MQINTIKTRIINLSTKGSAVTSGLISPQAKEIERFENNENAENTEYI